MSDRTKLRALIIDDSPQARKLLLLMLHDLAEDIDIVGQAEDVEEGLKLIQDMQPDALFLDIEMPDYNGFELLDFFKEINFEIIFATAYSQYALKAFEVSAIDYLLKPIDIDQLKIAVNKAAEKRNQSNIMQRLELLKETYKGEEIRKIALPMSDGLLFVDVNEIIHFEADRAYTHVYMKNGSKLTVSKPMRVFEDILDNRTFFFRPHRSYLINLNYLRKYNRGESLIVMDNQVVVNISREKKAEFDALLKELRLAI